MILSGKPVKEDYLKKLLEIRETLKRTPRLKIISDNSEDSEVYKRSILRYAKELSVEIVEDDEEADGIISLGKSEINIPFDKDIEGISPYHLGLLSYGKPIFLPPTPYASLKILEYYGFSLEGKVCAVVGRSVRVGKPLGLLILMFNGTPIIAHSKTKDLKKILKESDYVFLAANLGEYFGKEYFSENSVIVDISTVYKDGKLVGDAKFEELKDFVKGITPVPGGVGTITPLVLFENLFKAVQRRSQSP